MTNFENQKNEILKFFAVNRDWCIWDDGTMHSCYEVGSCNKCKFITYKDRGCKNEKRHWLDQECEQQPSDEPDDGWILVRKRLPENTSNKLVTIEYDLDNRKIIDMANYRYDDWYYSHTCTKVSGRVIAWKHMPDLYEEEIR